MPKVLVVEGNPPELALACKRSTGGTPAERYADALREVEATLEFGFASPYFSDHDLSAIDFSAYDGMAITGSGVEWSAADDRAAPFWRICEAAFASGTPVLGSCWGMQVGAVVLGGTAEAGPNGVEPGFARAIRPTDHPMHAGRRDSFDVIAMHRDDVTKAPEGAVVTATNDHTAIQAFAYEKADADLWAVQYHPECTVADVGYWFGRDSAASGDAKRARAGREIARIAEDPILHASAAAKHRVGIDILDRSYHLTELRNWLNAKVL